eukprot:gene15036-biopygen20157
MSRVASCYSTTLPVTFPGGHRADTAAPPCRQSALQIVCRVAQRCLQPPPGTCTLSNGKTRGGSRKYRGGGGTHPPPLGRPGWPARLGRVRQPGRSGRPGPTSPAGRPAWSG